MGPPATPAPPLPEPEPDVLVPPPDGEAPVDAPPDGEPPFVEPPVVEPVLEPPVDEPPVAEPGVEPPVAEPPGLELPDEPEDPELGELEPPGEDDDPVEDAGPAPLVPLVEVVVVEVVAAGGEALAALVGTVNGGAPEVSTVAEPPPQPVRLVAATRPATRTARAPLGRKLPDTPSLTVPAAACACRSEGSR